MNHEQYTSSLLQKAKEIMAKNKELDEEDKKKTGEFKDQIDGNLKQFEDEFAKESDNIKLILDDNKQYFF